MTEITESMIERGMDELAQGYGGHSWKPVSEYSTHNAVRDILTAALSHDDTEKKEKQAMQRRTIINHVSVKIENDKIAIGTEGGGMWFFNRKGAPDLIAFIQQWLDHDPEEELIDHVHYLRSCKCDECKDDEEIDKQIIAAVREHDRKYGRPE